MDLTTTFQKTVSTGNFHMATRSSARTYNLNKSKALDKKLNSCDKEHLKFEMKPGKNLSLHLAPLHTSLLKWKYKKS